MPAFIHRLVQRVEAKADSLRATLNQGAQQAEAHLKDLVNRHWHPLADSVFEELPDIPAFAVDGSMRVVGLANGAFLAVCQALCLGHGGFALEDVDVEIVRGSLPRRSIQRIVELMQQYLEITLALECAQQIPPHSVLYLDGALYGQIPQLYPLAISSKEGPIDLPARILSAYLDLFAYCYERDIYLLSLAKTSHEAVHWKLWANIQESALELPDAEVIYRWTEARPGFSTPVILGTQGFVGGSRRLLADTRVQEAPAIVSFFVRLREHDAPFRVDLPAYCLDDSRRLIDVEGEVLDLQTLDLIPILRLLAADYGGSTVYNALLHSVDQEVRLTRTTFKNVYMKVIEDILGEHLPPDRSIRRFL